MHKFGEESKIKKKNLQNVYFGILYKTYLIISIRGRPVEIYT